MTLLLLLVTSAALISLAAIILETPYLDAAGIVVGICLAVILGAAQFVGHHKLIAVINGKLNRGVWVEFLVIMYYAVILLLGVICMEFTLYAARSIGQST